MRTRWYIGALFLVFAYFGTFQERVSLPNQEIVLEFVDATIGQKELKNTVDDVREKLLRIGASNITIQETKSSILKISYYSTVPIDNIKEELLHESQLIENQDSEKKEDSSTHLAYKINVYELTNETDISNQNDQFVFEIKYYSDRYTSNHNYDLSESFELQKANQLFQTAYKSYKKHPFTKDYNSYKEPEVRAGPFVYFT